MASSSSSSNALATTTPGAGPSKPSLSLNRQVVLEEDEYTAALSHIIARDFFPSLAHIDATNNYLSALDSQDPTLIQQSARRLHDLGTPTPHRQRTPWGGRTPYGADHDYPETPLRTPLNATSAAAAPKYDKSLSLDAFQAKYTSEDNASFTTILDDENKERREKHWWAWDAENRGTERKGKEIEGRRQMLIAAGGGMEGVLGKSQRMIGGPEEVKAIEAPEQEKEASELADQDPVDSDIQVQGSDSAALVVRQDGGTIAVAGKAQDQPVDVMAPRKDTRVASVPGWNFKARNSLMFAPDANVSPYHPQPSSTSSTADESTPRGEPKQVKHANTRLPTETADVDDAASSIVPPSPTHSRIAAAIAGTPYHQRVDDTPKVGGFGFVDSLPSPSPDQLGPQAMKQLMTWGTLLGTPRIVNRDGEEIPDNGATPFRIVEPSSRDSLGRKLGGQAAKSLRAKADLLSSSRTPAAKRKRDGQMLPPSATPRRGAEMLSPAARSLLSRTKATSGALSGGLTPSSTPRRDVDGETSREKKRRLDLAKVGWSPRDTPKR